MGDKNSLTYNLTINEVERDIIWRTLQQHVDAQAAIGNNSPVKALVARVLDLKPQNGNSYSYRFLVNVTEDAKGRLVGFFGYEPGHKMQLAYTGTVDAANETQALDKLFEKFNINHPSDYRNRSMSVGDVVVLNDNDAYCCASVGWQNIAVPAEVTL